MNTRYTVKRPDGSAAEVAFDSLQGAYLWTSNDAPVPLDACEDYRVVDLPSYSEWRQADAIRGYARVAMALYRASLRAHGHSEEEKAEMRAAFGAGETVVDVITGERIAL